MPYSSNVPPPPPHVLLLFILLPQHAFRGHVCCISRFSGVFFFSLIFGPGRRLYLLARPKASFAKTVSIVLHGAYEDSDIRLFVRQAFCKIIRHFKIGANRMICLKRQACFACPFWFCVGIDTDTTQVDTASSLVPWSSLDLGRFCRGLKSGKPSSSSTNRRRTRFTSCMLLLTLVLSPKGG